MARAHLNEVTIGKSNPASQLDLWQFVLRNDAPIQFGMAAKIYNDRPSFEDIGRGDRFVGLEFSFKIVAERTPPDGSEMASRADDKRSCSHAEYPLVSPFPGFPHKKSRSSADARPARQHLSIGRMGLSLHGGRSLAFDYPSRLAHDP